ncbi:TonB-dependent receptor [Hyphococcus luteus]|uniref:TonB-dependent receptor n=1 Tax=Hyphococcus luteus TaxID=2058213 RepID=UPI0013FDC282|nr:TonB-dependent receptor [Marinicaulis flavus]
MFGLGVLSCAAAQEAADTRVDLDIPAQTAQDAVKALARAHKRSVLFQTEDVMAVNTNSLKGDYSLQRALDEMFQGTSLKGGLTESGVITVSLRKTENRSEGDKPMKKQSRFLLTTALSSFASVIATAAVAQDTGETAATPQDVIVVTGTNIRGARINEALPVTVFNASDIAAIGGVDGDDLIRALPANGAVNFRNDNAGTINSARGDVGSINLRSIGSSGTLVLLNGRRVVNHPGTQAELSTPVTTVNTNALPVGGLERMEVLNDGASAIYGSDAVAGVVNMILQDDYEGLSLKARHGTALDTELDEQTFILKAGKTFNGGATNVSLFAEYSRRDALFASEQEFSEYADLRPFLEGTSFEGDTSFRNLSTGSPWGQFTLGDEVTQNGTALTTSSGRFHVQPSSSSGCLADIVSTPGICIDDSSLNPELRYNIYEGRTIISDRDRFNVFTFLNHDLSDSVRFYGEFGYYYAKTSPVNSPNSPISSGDIVIPANYYYNPFGPVTFSDGSPNPNRLPGLDNVPAEGLPVFVDGGRFRLVDVGNRLVGVTNTSWRALAGMRGSIFDSNWDWDSALLFSRAKTNDVTDNRISSTLFQQALFNETPNVYNIFNGGNQDDPNNGDAPGNSRDLIDPFIIDVQRLTHTSLLLGDFKLSNGQLLSLPGGDLGLAFGAEVRREAYEEDRDPRLDGTITFTDAVTGYFTDSDVLNSSGTPDSQGSRTVVAGFAEASIPLVGPEMQIPLIHTFDIQAAARVEHYSDFGSSGVKPRIAAAWKPFSFLKFRGAWSEGFRAPNLIVINQDVARSNTREDSLLCHVGVENGTFAEFGDCDGFTESRQERRTSDPDIGPEDDRNITYGLVFQPRGIEGPFSFLNPLTITVDRWDIRRENVVGVFGAENHISLDLVQRLAGSSNPNVVRADPDADDIAFFAGTGLAPAGDILFVRDTYDNNETQSVTGTDFALYYDLDDTPLGDFNLKFNATKLREYFINLSPGSQMIADAIEAGLISNEIDIAQEGDIVRQDGQPRWRAMANVSWRHASGLGGGARFEHVGSFIDPSAGLNDDDEPFIVKSWRRINLYAQYDIENNGVLSGTRLRVGVNNLLDKEPPLADETFGYYNEYHSSRGRFLYFEVKKDF